MTSLLNMNAIILAGGQSSRMKRDKALLPFAGKTVIESLIQQLKPRFKDLIISCSEKEKFANLPHTIVEDQEKGKGPLMGILSSMKASSSSLNFVIACDIPSIDFSFLKKMVRLAQECEIVVPVTREGKYEPLFSIYHRSTIPMIEDLLKQNINTVIDIYPYCRVKKITLTNDWLLNLNTDKDYQDFLNAGKK